MKNLKTGDHLKGRVFSSYITVMVTKDSPDTETEFEGTVMKSTSKYYSTGYTQTNWSKEDFELIVE